jgi:hypothetical protein
MNTKLALLLVASAIATVGLLFLYKSTYPYVLASEEARASTMVTEAQSAELSAATRSSDMIGYGILGALLCSVVAFVTSLGKPLSAWVPGLLLGLVCGALFGAAAGWLGHWFESKPAFSFDDIMMHVLVRSFVMFLPLTIVCGAVAALSYRSGKAIGSGIGGAVMGLVGVVALYAVLSGTLTQAEGRHKIFPAWESNRGLLLGSMFSLIGVGVLMQFRSLTCSGPTCAGQTCTGESQVAQSGGGKESNKG